MVVEARARTISAAYGSTSWVNLTRADARCIKEKEEIPISGILYPLDSLALARGDEHSSMRLTQGASRRAAATPLFDLAPAEVYLAAEVTPDTGGLLPHRFTVTVLC